MMVIVAGSTMMVIVAGSTMMVIAAGSTMMVIVITARTWYSITRNLVNMVVYSILPKQEKRI